MFWGWDSSSMSAPSCRWLSHPDHLIDVWVWGQTLFPFNNNRRIHLRGKVALHVLPRFFNAAKTVFLKNHSGKVSYSWSSWTSIIMQHCTTIKELLYISFYTHCFLQYCWDFSLSIGFCPGQSSCDRFGDPLTSSLSSYLQRIKLHQTFFRVWSSRLHLGCQSKHRLDLFFGQVLWSVAASRFLCWKSRLVLPCRVFYFHVYIHHSSSPLTDVSPMWLHYLEESLSIWWSY